MFLHHNDIRKLSPFDDKNLSCNQLCVYLWKHHFVRSELAQMAREMAPWLLTEKDGNMCDKRFVERISVRLLCEKLFGAKCDIMVYHPSGRPYLKDIPFEISVSHTKDCYALSVASFRHGMDVEGWGSKAARVRRMFINDEDRSMLKSLSFFSDEEQMTLLWSAKEAVYKYVDQKGLSFREDIHSCSLDEENSFGAFLPKQRKKVCIAYKTTPDCVLTCCGPAHFAIK